MSEWIIEMCGISKQFPGTKALDNVDLKVKYGEIHALLGENGAGKSTLMNVLIGIHKMDEGEILYKGEPYRINATSEALGKGIALVPQELNLIPEASVAENIFLGNERLYKKFKGFIDWKQANREAKLLLKEVGLDIDVTKKVKHLSAAYQQLVSIARSLSYNPSVLILDEPTSAMTSKEADTLFETMQRLKAKGTSIIFITHHLDEVMSQADRMTIMRDGRVVHVCDKKDITVDGIITYMANREIKRRAKEKRTVCNEVFFEAKNFSRENEYKNASFDVRKGEILCIAGLIGSGRTELFKSIFGLTKPMPGAKTYIEGTEVKINSSRDAINLGIGYIPEERRQMGIFPILDICENMMLPSYKKLSYAGLINSKKARETTDKFIKSMKIKTSSQEVQIKNLSGGNQQKVIVARWIALGLRMLIMDEPTRGIDVNAKAEIHQLIREMANQGASVVIISSEVEEILELADRILVMHLGEIRGVMDNCEDLKEEDILKSALQ
ncbi:MAG: sugar ABC transporter ATP-binding protein [Bacillota bacterium]|jgi:ribose transport system ATP-binding protein